MIAEHPINRMDADGHVDRPVFHPALVPHLHHQGIKKQNRIPRFKRLRLLCLNLFDHRIGNFRDQRRRYFNAITLGTRASSDKILWALVIASSLSINSLSILIRSSLV